MKISNFRSVLLSACTVAAVASTVTLSGYSLSGRTWATSSVLDHLNPQNVSGLTQTAILDALKRAADGWRDQTHANVELVYAGTTSGGSFGLNYKNEISSAMCSPAMAAKPIGGTTVRADWSTSILASMRARSHS